MSNWAIVLTDLFGGKLPLKVRRDNRWPAIRKKHLEKHPNCSACGGSRKLEVHHLIPVHLNPDLELDPKNLVTLCEAKKYGLHCHLLIGHLGDYRRFNESCLIDAGYWLQKLGPK